MMNMLLYLVSQKVIIALKVLKIFFEQDTADYKFILNHFCLECMIGLLRFLIGGLNRVTHDCVVPGEIRISL